MRDDIAKRLARFVRRRRGQMTLEQFSRKTGVSVPTLSRLESRNQNVTLKTLQQLVDRLKCEIVDVFKND